MSSDKPLTSDFERAATQLEQVPPPLLELLQRQTIAFLYAIGRAQGVQYKVIRLKSEEEQEAMEE